MLLTLDDLPGEGWRALDERTWRTGRGGTRTDWAKQARDAKSITAWRSFEQVGEQRGLWCEVVPLASQEDAEAALGAVPEMGLRNLGAKVRLTNRREVAVPPPAGGSRVWAREETTEGANGIGRALYLAWSYQQMLNILACSGGEDRWDWPQVQALAEAQTTRVEAALRG